MNQNIVDQLAERVINETNSAISCLTLYFGHKLDLSTPIYIELDVKLDHMKVHPKTYFSDNSLPLCV